MKTWFAWIMVGCLLGSGCAQSVSVPGDQQARSGVRSATAEVQTGTDGLTIEQRNVRDRLKEDNKPGSIKHLYVISAYSGDVLIYSTVRGKVTSSGKRLSPTSVSAGYTSGGSYWGIPVMIAGQQQHTGEVLQDDGTYGGSVEYLFWFDAAGRYHQHYPSGGQIVHVSNEPLAVKKVILNLESKEIE